MQNLQQKKINPNKIWINPVKILFISYKNYFLFSAISAAAVNKTSVEEFKAVSQES